MKDIRNFFTQPGEGLRDKSKRISQDNSQNQSTVKNKFVDSHDKTLSERKESTEWTIVKTRAKTTKPLNKINELETHQQTNSQTDKAIGLTSINRFLVLRSNSENSINSIEENEDKRHQQIEATNKWLNKVSNPMSIQSTEIFEHKINNTASVGLTEKVPAVISVKEDHRLKADMSNTLVLKSTMCETTDNSKNPTIGKKIFNFE